MRLWFGGVVLCVFCMIRFGIGVSNAQNTNRSFNKLSVSQLTDNIYSYLSLTKEEKLYLHIDKESCQAGDTIWFKGYLVSAVTNMPADLSRYIYVELLDRNNEVQWREKVGLSSVDSVFKGYFPISENLKQGDYVLHAYTYWMQNQDDAYHFTKLIRVLNPYDHNITCKLEVLNDGGEGKRTLKITLLNDKGERYKNIPFMYKIPGETPYDKYEWSNTGYNGISRITIKDPHSDHIWIRSANSSEWDLEQYLRIPGTELDFDVQFLPEGGGIVPDVKQKIAFKAVRRDGLGVEVRGRLVDTEGNIIATFKSNHLGIGSFYATLESDKHYIAKVNGIDGNMKEFPILSDKNSVAIQLNISGANINYDILSSNIRDFSNYQMLIHSRGIPMAIFNAERMRMRGMDFSGSPEGILHFVLLDSVLNVCSERLWFHRKIDRDSLVVSSTNSKRVSPRSNAGVSLLLQGDSDSTSLVGEFSLSVIHNGHSRYNNCSGGIEAYMLLSSDLMGYVEQPGYYFSSTNNSILEELDNLMLTQGWRRFDIAQYARGDVKVHNPYYLERGQFLSGYVKNFRGKNSANSDILLIGTNGLVRELVTDSSGRFVENDLWYDVGTRFVVQAISEKGKSNLELQLDNPEFRQYYATKVVMGESESSASYVDEFGKSYVFADNGERITTLGVVRVHGNGIAKMQQDIINDIEFDRRRNFLVGVTGLWNFGGVPGDWSQVAKIRLPQYYKDAYRIALAKRTDKLENRMGDNDYFSNFYSNTYIGDDMRDMAFYHESMMRDLVNKNSGSGDVMNGEAAHTIVREYGADLDRGLMGIKLIHPFTSVWLKQIPRHPNEVEAQNIVAIPIYDIGVYYVDYQFNMQAIVPFAPQQQNVEFYKPSYDVATELLKEPIDEKITRYWNPSVRLESGKAFEFEFPTAQGEGSGSYTVVIEGILENGTPIHKSWRYDVK